jgi:hypothetical protein
VCRAPVGWHAAVQGVVVVALEHDDLNLLHGYDGIIQNSCVEYDGDESRVSRLSVTHL